MFIKTVCCRTIYSCFLFALCANSVYASDNFIGSCPANMIGWKTDYSDASFGHGLTLLVSRRGNEILYLLVEKKIIQNGCKEEINQKIVDQLPQPLLNAGEWVASTGECMSLKDKTKVVHEEILGVFKENGSGTPRVAWRINTEIKKFEPITGITDCNLE